MKKTLFIICCAALCAACNNQLIDTDVPVNTKSFTVSTESATATSAALDGLDVTWVAGDAISVFAGEANDKYATEGSGSSASFSFAGEGDPSSAEKMYALAPYSASATLFENVITTAIPNVQKGVANGVDPAAMLMAAVTTTSSLEMKNAVALIRIAISSSDISSVTIASKTGVGIAGRTTITVPDEGEPTVAATDPSILLIPNKTKFAAGTYYIAAAPAAITGGIQVTLTTTDGKVRIATGESDCILYRSRVKELGDIESRAVEQTLTTYTLTFSNGTAWSNPFTSPSDEEISSTSTSPSFANTKKTAVTADGLTFEFFAKAGVNRNGSQGFRWGKKTGDYFRFPVIEGQTLMGVKLVLGGDFCVAGLAQVDGGVVNGGSNPVGTVVAGNALYWFNTNPIQNKQYELRSLIDGSGVNTREIVLYYTGSAKPEPLTLVVDFTENSTTCRQPFKEAMPTSTTASTALGTDEQLYTLVQDDVEYSFATRCPKDGTKYYMYLGYNKDYGTGLFVKAGGLDVTPLTYIKFPAVPKLKLTSVTFKYGKTPTADYPLYICSDASSKAQVTATKVGECTANVATATSNEITLSGTAVNTSYYVVFGSTARFFIDTLTLKYE